MSGSQGAVVRLLVVAASTIAALFIADYIGLRVLGLFVEPDAQGRYSVNYLAGQGYAAALSTLINIAVLLFLVALTVRIVYARRPLDRIVVIAGGYVVACVAAAALLLVSAALISRFTRDPGSTIAGSLDKTAIEQVASLFGIAFYLGAVIGFFALIPALPVIAHTERKRIRSLAFYAIAGTLTGLASFAIYLALIFSPAWWPWLTGAPRSGSTGISASSPEAIRLVLSWFSMFVVPGLGGGLIYWIAAGRTAGGNDRILTVPSEPSREPQA